MTTSSAYRWVVLLFGILAYGTSHFSRQNYTGIQKFMQADFDLDRGAIGLLGASFFYAYAVFQMPWGIAADRFGSRVTLVHVYERVLSPIPPLGGSGPADGRTEEEALASLGSQLRAIRNTRFARITEVDVVLAPGGNPAITMCEYGAQHGVDLVVLSTHGRTGLARMLVGSVAERVVRHATSPVLVVPSRLEKASRVPQIERVDLEGRKYDETFVCSERRVVVEPRRVEPRDCFGW